MILQCYRISSPSATFILLLCLISSRAQRKFWPLWYLFDCYRWGGEGGLSVRSQTNIQTTPTSCWSLFVFLLSLRSHLILRYCLQFTFQSHFMGFSNGFFSKRTLFNVIGPGETKENFKLKRHIRKITIILTVIKSAIRIIEIYWIVRECTIYGSCYFLQTSKMSQ